MVVVDPCIPSSCPLMCSEGQSREPEENVFWRFRRTMKTNSLTNCGLKDKPAESSTLPMVERLYGVPWGPISLVPAHDERDHVRLFGQPVGVHIQCKGLHRKLSARLKEKNYHCPTSNTYRQSWVRHSEATDIIPRGMVVNTAHELKVFERTS